MHNLLFETYGSLKIIELLELKQGLRSYARWVIPRQDEKRYERILSVSKIPFLKSDFLLAPIENKMNDDNYFHEYMRNTTKNSNDGSHIIMYLSTKNPKAIKLAEGDHKTMGKLLGYPDCCIKSFIDYHKSANLTKILNDKTVKHHEKLFMNNNVLAHPYYYNLNNRHKGVSMLSHIPCSTHCDDTHKIAKDRGMLIETHDTDLYDSLRKALSGEFEIKGKKVIFY